MIARLKGTVDALGDGWAIIDVHGVGYLVSASSRTLGRMVAGQAAALGVETMVREDAITLFGFADTTERDWFRLLMTVQGVGGKVALALLSALPADELARAIAAGDKTTLSRAQGVGAKLAARLATELKDKAGIVAPFATAGIAAVVGGGDDAATEAVSALMNLGYRQVEAAAAIARARTQLGEAAATAQLVRTGLRELGKERTS